MKQETKEKIVAKTVGFLGKLMRIDAVALTSHYLYGFYSDDGRVAKDVAALVERNKDSIVKKLGERI